MVFTESKAKYLQTQCSLPIETNIRWWDKSGRNTKQGRTWLRDNLEPEIAWTYRQHSTLHMDRHMRCN